MASLLVMGVFLVSVLTTLVRGPLAAFCWVFAPVVIAIPCDAMLELPGLPEFSAPRIATLGILAGSVMTGRTSELIPRWHPIDLLPLAIALSFAISFGQRTVFMGFVNKIVQYGFDWAAPYVLARALIRDRRALLMLLGPAVVLTTFFGMTAVYEMRMAARPVEIFWTRLGVPTPLVLEFHEQLRLNMLRAHLHFSHPLTMGAFFTAMGPLVFLRGVLMRQKLLHFGFALIAGCGVFASLSRGPIAVLVLVALIFWFAKAQPKVLIVLGVLLAAVLAGPAARFYEEIAAETQAGLEQYGNVPSDYYRVALLILYGSRIAEFGLWGDPGVVASEYSAAWSIDNSYLYQFIFGGMLGGGMFLAFALGVLVLGYGQIIRSHGSARALACCINASAFGLALALANVWFSEDIYIVFWVVSALVVNLKMTSLLASPTQAAKVAAPAEARRAVPIPARDGAAQAPAPRRRLPSLSRPGPTDRLRPRDRCRGS